MWTAKLVVEAKQIDPFGPSVYFQFPALVFLVLGWIGKLLGGITLVNVRTAHAASGVLIVLASYALFRTARTPLVSFLGATLVGTNHALLAISRMAMRDNTALLVEGIALALLLSALQRGSHFRLFGGGIALGFTFYMYYASRATAVLWFVFLAIVSLREASAFRARLAYLGRASFPTLIGALLVATPLFIAVAKQPASSISYGREQLLIFPEARALQMRWEQAATVEEAIRQNLVNGLSAFNRPLHDRGYIYANYDHGFADPATGILLWIGVLSVVLIRPRQNLDVLALSSFLFLWLFLAFLTTKNPSYTRLLTVLPFLAYLGLRGMETMVRQLVLPTRRAFVMASGVCVIAAWNLAIFGDFVNVGLANGNDVGGTARYVEAKTDPTHAFYLAADADHPYYSWGEAWQWKGWIGFFARPTQRVQVLTPRHIMSALQDPPFTLFMNRTVWEESQEAIGTRYPKFRLLPMIPNGFLLAVEIAADQ